MASVLGASAVAWLLLACGSPTQGNDPFAPADAPCISCNGDGKGGDASAWQPTPRVSAYPGELLFYGELTSKDSLPPQKVTVKNNTVRPVMITAAYITDDPTIPMAKGGAEFFALSGYHEPTGLTSGEELSLEVSFGISTTQRYAILVVETDDPDHSSLVVDLSGKYIFDYSY